MNIRFADEKDSETLAQLYHETDKYYVGADAPSLAQSRAYVNKQFFAEHSGISIAIAFRGIEALGYATFSTLFPAPQCGGVLYLKDLFTRETARGTGVGKAMMKFLARYALEKGCTRMDWTAETDNPSALSFYEHLGAQRVEEKVYFRFENPMLVELNRE